ncbi:unnamed protein product [Musa hybrid cultivar]
MCKPKLKSCYLSHHLGHICLQRVGQVLFVTKIQCQRVDLTATHSFGRPRATEPSSRILFGHSGMLNTSSSIMVDEQRSMGLGIEEQYWCAILTITSLNTASKIRLSSTNKRSIHSRSPS